MLRQLAAILAAAGVAACAPDDRAPAAGAAPPAMPPDARVVEVCVLKEPLAEFPVMTTASGIISLDIPGVRTAVNVRVMESQPGTVEAWVGFEAADGYWLKPTWIRFREGEAFVLRLPGPTANLGERTVVITAGRRGEGPGC